MRARVDVIAAGIVFLLGALVALSFPTHHDNSWMLYVAGRVLDGDRLYRDIVEVNPPLIVWLSLPAELIGRATGAWATTVYRIGVLLVALGSLVACARSLSRLGGDSARIRALMLVVLAWLFTGAPGFEFGQREHLAVVMALPWLLLSAERLRHAPGEESTGPSRGEAVALGVLAGVGFALKPYFLAAWLLPEAWLMVRRGVAASRRAEGVALFATLVVYALAVAVITPDYFDIARMAALSYSGFSASSPLRFFLLWQAQLAAGAVALWLALRLVLRERDAGDIVALALVGFLAGVLAQRKGWAYHWIPTTTLAVALLTLALGLLLARFATTGAVAARPLQRWLPALAAAVALLLGIGALDDARTVRDSMRGRAYQLDGMMRLVAEHAGDGPIAALSTNMQAGFPLVDYTDVEWGMRFNALWALPAVYAPNPVGQPFVYRAPPAMPEVERYMFEAVVEDLARTRPTIIAIDRTAPGYVLNEFDYLAYFAQHPRFIELMRGYREGAPVERYRVLIRVQP